jgi:hypothetical protein
MQGSLTYRKILRHGAGGFTSPSKEFALRIFIALKNPSPWSGFNPRTLGPIAITLTITPLKRLPVTLQSVCLMSFRFVYCKLCKYILRNEIT